MSRFVTVLGVGLCLRPLLLAQNDGSLSSSERSNKTRTHANEDPCTNASLSPCSTPPVRQPFARSQLSRPTRARALLSLSRGGCARFSFFSCAPPNTLSPLAPYQDAVRRLVPVPGGVRASEAASETDGEDDARASSTVLALSCFKGSTARSSVRPSSDPRHLSAGAGVAGAPHPARVAAGPAAARERPRLCEIGAPRLSPVHSSPPVALATSQN